MKLSLLAAALVAIALTACDRPKQALPENSDIWNQNRGGNHVGSGTERNPERTNGRSSGSHGEDEFAAQAVLPGSRLMAMATPCHPAKAPFRRPLGTIALKKAILRDGFFVAHVRAKRWSLVHAEDRQYCRFNARSQPHRSDKRRLPISGSLKHDLVLSYNYDLSPTF